MPRRSTKSAAHSQRPEKNVQPRGNDSPSPATAATALPNATRSKVVVAAGHNPATCTTAHDVRFPPSPSNGLTESPKNEVFMRKLYCFPVIVGIVFPLTFITSFTIAVSLDHVAPFFSSISETGTSPPESSVFAFLLNISALFFGFVVYIRYKQVKEVFRHSDEEIWDNRMNKVGLVLGFIAAFGISVVGCFQETNVHLVHLLGAFMCFCGGNLYSICQAYLSFKMLPLHGSRVLAWIRSLVAVVSTLLFITCCATGMASFALFKGKKTVKWKPEDGGWDYHVTSVILEWTVAALFNLYILTFIPEFRNINFEAPKVHLIQQV